MLNISFAIDDAALESAIAAARAQYNATTGSDPAQAIDTDEAYVAKLSMDNLESLRGAAREALLAEVARLDYADLVPFKDQIDAAVAAKQLSPPVKLPPA